MSDSFVTLGVTAARDSLPRLLDDAVAGECSLVQDHGGLVFVVLLRSEYSLLHGAVDELVPIPGAATNLCLLRDDLHRALESNLLIPPRVDYSLGRGIDSPTRAEEVVWRGWQRAARRWHGQLPTPQAWYQVREARPNWRQLLDAAATGTLGIRRATQEFTVTTAERLDADLAQTWRFTPEVFADGDHTAIWLPELDVFGRGPDVDAAAADLRAEMRAYAEDWQRELRFAPNHRARLGWVRRIQFARTDSELDQLLDEPPEAA